MESLVQRHNSCQGEMKNQKRPGSALWHWEQLFFPSSILYILLRVKEEEEEEKKKAVVISGEACLTDVLVGEVEIERREQLSCSHILYLSKTCLSTRGRETGPTGSDCLRNWAVNIIKVNVSQWKGNTWYPHRWGFSVSRPISDLSRKTAGPGMIIRENRSSLGRKPKHQDWHKSLTLFLIHLSLWTSSSHKVKGHISQRSIIKVFPRSSK